MYCKKVISKSSDSLQEHFVENYQPLQGQYIMFDRFFQQVRIPYPYPHVKEAFPFPTDAPCYTCWKVLRTNQIWRCTMAIATQILLSFGMIFALPTIGVKEVQRYNRQIPLILYSSNDMIDTKRKLYLPHLKELM